MSTRSRILVLGFGLAGLMVEMIAPHPALAYKKVSLFKVITPRDEIVIGLSQAEMDVLEERNAEGIARNLIARGSLAVWRYKEQEVARGEFLQVPVGKVVLIANEALRIEPYASPFSAIEVGKDKS